MVTRENSSELLGNLRADPENNKCFECSSESPQFTSVNNGCFICGGCVPSHSSLGIEVSRVKAVDSDWTEDDLKLMISGGNSSLKEFFNHYNISNTPANFKYMTQASFFYRDMLSVISQDREYEHPCPSLEEGIVVVTASYPELGQLPQPEEVKVEQRAEESKGALAWAKKAYQKTVDAGNKAVDKMSAKLNQLSEKPSVKKVENKTLEIAGKIETGLNKVVEKVYSKPEVQSAIGQVNHATESFANEVKTNYVKINANPSVQKLKQDTMNLLKDLKNSISSNNQGK